MEGEKFTSFDDTRLHTYEFNEVKNPKGIVQIIHGMAEHAGRYNNIVEFLNGKGYIVFLSDHRGHGQTAETVKHIGIYKEDIFYDTVKDQIYFSEYLIDKYNLPLIVLGHSFGSFIAQRYAQLYTKHSALILSGSSYMKNDFGIMLGGLIANIGIKLKGPDAPAKLISRMTFKKYNKNFIDKNWLTSDKDEQRKQKVDRYCNKKFSHNFYKYFFSGIKDIYNRKNMQQVQLGIPMLLFSGKADALSKNGELVIKLKDFYKLNGVNTVGIKLYDKGRHEMLNEKDRKTVYKDLLEFIEKNVKFKEKK